MIINEKIKKQSAAEVITAAIKYCKNEGASIAIWKHPEQKAIQLLVDFDSPTEIGTDVSQGKVSGFIFSPFDSDNRSLLIKNDLHINLSSYQITQKDGLANSERTDHFLNALSSAAEATVDAKKHEEIEIIKDQEQDQKFKNLVELSVKAIKNGEFLKVVPSRNKKIKLPAHFNIGLNFVKLFNAYPAAFTSLVFTPETDVWMGVTPELLISEEGNIFKTVALAGTQKYNPEVPLSDVAWTQKEIEEQALVCRYIVNCFKKIRLRDYTEVGPKTIIAGNLLHLKNEYTVDMEATGFPMLGETMLKLLHPTSAICGMPLEKATAFLKENEHYDRKYFAGYLGPVNLFNNTSLFVNLRCMNIKDNEAKLFAGAGVTADSIPQREWEETEIKMNTLLNIIK